MNMPCDIFFKECLKSHIISFFSVHLSIYIPNVHIIATIRHEVAYFKNTCIALDTSRHLYETVKNKKINTKPCGH